MFSRCVKYVFLLLTLTSSVFAAQEKIVVIGAGLAGLTAAYDLQRDGYTVEVYEARERPGGRVLTAYFGGSYAELGGKFINDGGEAKRIRALIKEMGLEIENYTTVTPDRKYYYKGKTGPYYAPYFNCRKPDEAMLSLLQQWGKEVNNMGALLDRVFAGQIIARHLMELRMRGYWGSDSKKLSIHYLDEFWKNYQKIYAISHGEKQNVASHETVKGGNSLLTEKVAEKLKGHIHYNSILREISRTNEGLIQLRFGDGKVVTADCLVLAIPCSTLRDVKVQKGIIPSDQWSAIQTLQYGSNAYLLLEVMMGDEDKAEYSVTEDVIVWFNKDRTIMTLAYGGSVGEFNAQSSTVLSRMVHAEMPALKMLFPSMIYKENNRAVSWIHEEFSKGSYCNWGVGQFEVFNQTVEYSGEIVRKVFRPIDGKIFFAGEHTSLNYPATMEGAVESGELAARMVARSL